MRARSYVTTILAIPLLAGCSAILDAPAEARRPVRSFLEARQEGVVIQQWDISCGAAALATILTYQHEDPVTEREVAAGMLRRTSISLVRRRLGFSLLDLKRYAESRGLTADGYSDMTLADLVEAGPTIVPVILRRLPHFVIFRGIQGDRVLLADPAFGNRTMPIETFERVWQNRMGFTVTRTDGHAPRNHLAVRSTDFWASSLAFTPSHERVVMAANIVEPEGAASGSARAAIEREAPTATPVVTAGSGPPRENPPSVLATRDASSRQVASNAVVTRRTLPRADRAPLPEAEAHAPAAPLPEQANLRPERGPATPVGRWAAAVPASQPANPLELLQRRGEAMLALGDISAARLLYERAAPAGSALAARSLGETYDPSALVRLGVRGLQPDPAMAAAWYERAASLGDAEAASRIRAMRDSAGANPLQPVPDGDKTLSAPHPATAPPLSQAGERMTDAEQQSPLADTWALLEASDKLVAHLLLRIEMLEGDHAIAALARRIDRIETEQQFAMSGTRAAARHAVREVPASDDAPIILAEAWSGGVRPAVAAMIAERLAAASDAGSR